MSQPTPGQLELFDLARQQAPLLRREAAGRFSFAMRHDQLILAAIGSLIGLTVIFACGVERGKQLARGEQPLLDNPVPADANQANASVAAEPAAAKLVVAAPNAARPASAKTTLVPAESSVADKAVNVPAKSAEGKFAVQLVTYSKPQLARQELQRLQDRGEKAFLVTRKGRVVLYAGPFESKNHATDRLAALRNRYQDGFVKTL